MHLLRVPPRLRRAMPLGHPEPGQLAGDPPDRLAGDEPVEHPPHPLRLVLAYHKTLLRLGPAAGELRGPVCVQVVRRVPEREVAGAAVGHDPPLLAAVDAVLQVAERLSVVKLEHLQLPPAGRGVDALSGRDEPAASEDEILDERVRVLGAGEPGLVVDSQHRNLAAGDHVAQPLEPVAGGLGARLGLVVDDDDLQPDDPQPGQRGADLPLLVGAAVGPLHVGGIPAVDDDVLARHRILPRTRDEFRPGCSRPRRLRWRGGRLTRGRNPRTPRH